MALDTVQDYIDRARTPLLDTYNGPYRYSDADVVENLNMGILEARRLRPELFLSSFSATLPDFSAAVLIPDAASPIKALISLPSPLSKLEFSLIHS